MQKIILRQNKTLYKPNSVKLFKGEQNIDFLQFYIPNYYNNIDLSDCNIKLVCVMPNGIESSFSIDEFKETTCINDYYVYSIPIDQRFTEIEGKISIQLIITKQNNKILDSTITHIYVNENLNGITTPLAVDIPFVATYNETEYDAIVEAIKNDKTVICMIPNDENSDNTPIYLRNYSYSFDDNIIIFESIFETSVINVYIQKNEEVTQWNYINTKLATVNSVDNVMSKVPFVAIYGETSYTEIKQAIDDNKIVVCKGFDADHKFYTLNYTNILEDSGKITFSSVEKNIIFTLYLSEDNKWWWDKNVLANSNEVNELKNELKNQVFFVATFKETTYGEVFEKYQAGQPILLYIPNGCVSQFEQDLYVPLTSVEENETDGSFNFKFTTFWHRSQYNFEILPTKNNLYTIDMADADISNKLPFKAMYGETSYADIVQAIEDGREVSCTQERAGIKMNLCYTGMNLTTNTLSFQNTQGDMIYGANILENNTWQMYSIKLSEEIAQKNLFVATYGETTYKEVLDNYNSGNQIFLTVPGSVVDGSADGSIHIATLTTLNQEKGYVFFDFDTGISHYSCGLNKNSQWGCERTLLTTSQQFEAFQTSTTTSLEKLKTFTAIFNVTKFSAIQSAYNQGKRIVLEDGWLKGELNILSPNSYAQFSALDDMGNPVTFKVTTDDVWKKTSTTHVPLKDFDNFTVNAEYSIKFLNDKITDNSDQISKIFTNYVPKITDIDYEILSAGERYYISKPGLYLFVGNDYDLNLYNHNQNADSSAILGNSKNLIIAMIVAENKNDNKFFRTFYGKTYKKLGIATPESSVVDLRRYSGDSNFAYVHNTSTNGNATIFYIKPQ